MMKCFQRITISLTVLFMTGCATVQIPAYLKDVHPYQKRFYADFVRAQSAVEQTLKEFGWVIETRADPLIYEQRDADIPGNRQILLMTEIRQTGLVVGSRFGKLNIYIRSKDGISEIELRTIMVTSLPMRNLTSYRNDALAERFYEHLRGILETQ